MGGPGRALFDAISRFDKAVIDGAVDGVANAVGAAGAVLRRTQTGRVRNSAIGLATGAVAVLVYFVVRMSF